MGSIKGKDLKQIVADLDDDADVVITMNCDRSNCLSVDSAAVDEAGDLLLNIVHYCND